MQKVLAISGRKQAGKTTCINFLHGYIMKCRDVIEYFDIDENGRLIVNSVFTDSHGEEQKGTGILDIFRKDFNFSIYAKNNIWPIIKSYNFADPLKNLCISLFGMSYEQCYGTEQQKNSPTTIKKPREKNKYYTAREFLQFFGTDVCRKIRGDIWTSACISQIAEEQSEFAVIGDCRFPNEAESIQKIGGKIIRLTRSPYEDEHVSETALDDFDNFDAVIDNKNMTIDEQNAALLNILFEWGWIESIC